MQILCNKEKENVCGEDLNERSLENSGLFHCGDAVTSHWKKAQLFNYF